MRGKIKQLKENYGFIQTSQSKEWYWFGFRGLDIADQLNEGTEVEFEEAPGKDGKKSAKNIRIIGQSFAVPNVASAMETAKEDPSLPVDIQMLCRYERDGKRPHNDLFSSYAKKIASILGKEGQKNSPTQLRRFYEQLVRYYDDIRFQPDTESKERALEHTMPYILMLESRVHEAFAKDKVDRNFKTFIDVSISQLRNDPTLETLKIFKTQFEAVIGFYKTK